MRHRVLARAVLIWGLALGLVGCGGPDGAPQSGSTSAGPTTSTTGAAAFCAQVGAGRLSGWAGRPLTMRSTPGGGFDCQTNPGRHDLVVSWLQTDPADLDQAAQGYGMELDEQRVTLPGGTPARLFTGQLFSRTARVVVETGDHTVMVEVTSGSTITDTSDSYRSMGRLAQRVAAVYAA